MQKLSNLNVRFFSHIFTFSHFWKKPKNYTEMTLKRHIFDKNEEKEEKLPFF
jgi:hypothetical protein